MLHRLLPALKPIIGRRKAVLIPNVSPWNEKPRITIRWLYDERKYLVDLSLPSEFKIPGKVLPVWPPIELKGKPLTRGGIVIKCKGHRWESYRVYDGARVTGIYFRERGVRDEGVQDQV